MLDVLEKEVKSLKEETEKTNIITKTNNELLNKKTKLLQDKKEKIKTLSTIDKDLQKLENERENLRKKHTQVKDLISLFTDTEKKQQELKKAQEEFLNLQKISQESLRNFTILNELFLSEQAGILAERLILGEPCPVCGSTTHPNKATKTPNAPTKEQLDSAKTKADTDNSNQTKASEKASALKGELDAKNEQIKDVANQLFDNPNVDLKYCESQISEITNLGVSLKEEIGKLINKQKEKELLEKEIPILETEKEELHKTILIGTTNLSSLTATIEQKDGQVIKLKQKLKEALSRQSIEELYTQKVIFGAIAFVAGFIVCFSVIQMGSEYVRNSTQQLSLVATNEMEQYSHESILMLDERYMAQRLALQPEKTLKNEIAEVVLSIKQLIGLAPKPEDGAGGSPDLSEDAIKAMVSGYMPGLSDLQVLDQVKRLQDKFETVQNTKFHWWLVWVCFLIGLLGYNIPNLLIMLRKMMVKTDAEDDFLQLQTLVSIYMTTDMDTLDTLYELSQHSRIHKDMLTYCYHSYPANPELELTRLQSKTPLTEFKRFIGKLKLTISDLSMQEAFSDLVIEREQIMRIREITIQATIDKKRGLCGPLSLTPLGCMVVGELLIPLGYLGVREFMSAMTMME